jgi:hypothetical protein
VAVQIGTAAADLLYLRQHLLLLLLLYNLRL